MHIAILHTTKRTLSKFAHFFENLSPRKNSGSHTKHFYCHSRLINPQDPMLILLMTLNSNTIWWDGFQKYKSHSRSRDNALGYGLDDQWFESRQGLRIFLSPPRPDRLWGPSSLLSNGYQGPFPWGKRPRHEVDHSPQPSAEVKNAWSYTSSPNTPSWLSAQLKHINLITKLLKNINCIQRY
jgi:hypothetical protein